MQKSTIEGLTSFPNGFVKEGVGAGGISVAAMLKSKGNLDGYSILRATEKEYQKALKGN
jgi:NaMN:DMB phosphoribosyltransferase